MRSFEKLFVIVLLLTTLAVTYKTVDMIFLAEVTEAQSEYQTEQSKIIYFKAKKLLAAMEKYGGYKEFNERLNDGIRDWVKENAWLDKESIEYFSIINQEYKEIYLLFLIIISVQAIMIVYLIIQLKKPNKENSHGQI